MITRTFFVGRIAAENLMGATNWAIISVSEGFESKLIGDWHDSHHCYFHDVDPAKPCDEPHVLMNAGHADQIFDFVESVAPNVDVIVVNCKAGISRSAAISKWIAERYDLPFNHGYQHYNQHVYSLLKESSERNKLSNELPD